MPQNRNTTSTHQQEEQKRGEEGIKRLRCRHSAVQSTLETRTVLTGAPLVPQEW